MILNNKEYKFLFLDRDGVINVERKNDYAKNVSEFIFERDALKAIKILSEKFQHIFVVTNQRGVGRGIMSVSDLEKVHYFMVQEIENENGQISDIYYCTDTCSSSINRKPNIGMAFQIQERYPEVQFSESIMVGNSQSDIEFGYKLGMRTVLVGDKYPKENKIYEIADCYYMNLYDFALSL